MIFWLMRVFAYTISACPSQKQRALAEVLLVLENGGLVNGARYICIYRDSIYASHDTLFSLLQCEAPACYEAGKQYRNIYCYYGNKIVKYYHDNKCNITNKPPTEQPCMKTKDCPPTWIVSTFGPVSKSPINNICL